MDKYIKVDDLIELIDSMHKDIQNDYDSEKICFSSNIAMIGTLEVLKQNINAKLK